MSEMGGVIDPGVEQEEMKDSIHIASMRCCICVN